MLLQINKRFWPATTKWGGTALMESAIRRGY